MYIHFKPRLHRPGVIAGLLFMLTLVLNAQVTITTVVTPPYTSNFSSYAEKVKVTVISPSTGWLRLNMTLKGDNGVSIKTGEIGTTEISANTPLLVPTDYLYDVFNTNYIIVSGMSASELSAKGLPAGTYQLCFTATVIPLSVPTQLTGTSCSNMFRVELVRPPRVIQPLCGSEQYRGGLQNVLISWSPSPGAPVWTSYTLRIVEMRDTLLSPAQALRSGTRPSFFEEEITGTSYLYGPKDPPLEKGCWYAFEVVAYDGETNTRFANNGHSEMCYFKYGRDEEFNSKNVSISTVKPKVSKTTERPAITAKQDFAGILFSPVNVSGTLYYQYAGPDLPITISSLPGSQQTIDFPDNTQTINMPGNTQTLDMPGNTQTLDMPGSTQTLDMPGSTQTLDMPGRKKGAKGSVSIQGTNSQATVSAKNPDATRIVKVCGKNITLQKVSAQSVTVSQGVQNNAGYSVSDNFNNMPTFFHHDIRDVAKSKPLGNIPVSLVVRYVIFDIQKGKRVNVTLSDLQNTYLADRYSSLPPGRVVASGYTGEDGTFDFTFFLNDSLGVLDNSCTVRVGSGSDIESYTGILYRSLRLVTNSPYYCNSTHDIVVQPGESKSYDDLYSLVKTYGLTVETLNRVTTNNVFTGAIQGLDVYLMRKTDMNEVPGDEGYPKPLSEVVADQPGFRVIAHTKTDGEGKASFLHLVRNFGGYDKYYIYVNSDSHESMFYKSMVGEFRTVSLPFGNKDNDKFEYTERNTSIDIYPQSPVFYGHVSQASGMVGAEQGMAVEDAEVSIMVNIGITNLTVMSYTTGENGDYRFTPPEMFSNKVFSLSAEKNGYSSGDDGPLNNGDPIMRGQKVKKDIVLKPKALLLGKITDGATGYGVRCYLTVVGGETVQSAIPTLEAVATGSSSASSSVNTLSSADMQKLKVLSAGYGFSSSTTLKPATLISTTSILENISVRESVPKATLQASSSKLKFSSKTPVSAAGNISVAEEVRYLPTGPSYYALPSPSGEQTIIVMPDNEEYFTDTICVNLSDGENTQNFMVMKKMHRIRLEVTTEVDDTEQGVILTDGQRTIEPLDRSGSRSRTSARTDNNAGTGKSKSSVKKKTVTASSLSQTNQTPVVSANNMAVNVTPLVASGEAAVVETRPVRNARVRVLGRPDYVTTDVRGNAFLEFEGSDNFDIEILPPEDEDYEKKVVSYSGFSVSKTYRVESVILKKAARVSGVVTFNGSPVEGATVRLNYPGKDIDTVTASDGTYTLRYIPVGEELEFTAARAGYIGAAQTVTVPLSGLNNVDFELAVSDEYDYSRLLGFPVEVVNETKEAGKTFIDGYFTGLPQNGQIEVSGNTSDMSFDRLEISKGNITGESGLPYPVPVNSTFKVDINTIALSLNDTFTGRLESDDNGIIIAKGDNDTTGYIKGKVSVNTDVSFQITNVDFGQEKLYVMSTISDQAPKVFNVISSSGDKPLGDNDIPLFDQTGKNINYVVYGFNCEAEAKNSRIEGDRVKLKTILHTDIQNTSTPDLAVNLGDVEFTTENIIPISKTSVITMPLEKWTLKATKWSLNSNGFKLTQGEVVTHMANIEFTNIEVEPDRLTHGTFNLETMNIRGMTNLVVTGNASFFSEAGHWILAITPLNNYCGYIAPLPGMSDNNNINLTSVFLKSNKTGSFNVESKPFKLYDIVDFNPTSLDIYDDRIEFPGTVDLNIPDVASRTAMIKYTKTGSEVKGFFQPFIFGFSTKGVDLSFTLDANSLSEAGFTAKGTLSEPGLYSVNVQLNHNKSKTEIVDIPGQTFPIDKSGNRKLNDFDGEMHVSSGHWTNFIFSGDLAGANGASGRLTFVVNGDITADDQAVEIDNISTPFGDLKLTYDFEKGRLIGILEIEQELNGTGMIKGSAESVIDSEGWYFCAGGKITMRNNPYIKSASTALLFGDYPSLNDPFITQTFAEYSYSHALPTAFQSYIKGFYIDGTAEFPVPYIPEIDIDLVVVRGRLSVTAGGNFSLGMNFSDAGNVYYTGAAVYVNAYVGLNGSIGIACAGASFNANLEVASHGELRSNGDWFLDGSTTLTLTGKAYVGCGCCDGDCDGYYLCPCFSDKWGGSVSIGMLVHMGSDENYVRMQW